MKKVFTDVQKQIEILKSKGLIINNEQDVMYKLARTNYYALINAYREPFLADRKQGERSTYITGARFEEIFEIYKFDRNIRVIFLKYMLILENNFKSAISYEFSKIYGYQDYLRLENFDNKQSNVKDIFNLISWLMESLSRSISKNDYITYYIEKYNYVPFWVLSNTLTLGSIINFYRLMKEDEREYIAKNYFGVKSEDLQAYIRLVNSYRNICAHNERFYCVAVGEDIPFNNYYNYFKVTPQKRGNAFALLVSMCILLEKEDKQNLLSELERQINDTKNNLQSISIAKLYDMMGFPYNWEKMKKID